MRWRPTQGPHVPKISLVEWLRFAFSKPDQVTDDIHFDQLAANWDDVRNGEEWVLHGRTMLREVKRTASTCPNLRGVQQAVVALPAGRIKAYPTMET